MAFVALHVILPSALALQAGCLVPRGASAATLYVGGSSTGAFSRIQDAVDAASPGDTVLVLPGRYQETISIVAKDLHLISSHGPASTAIDGAGKGPVIHCLQLSEDSSIQGFTITGGVTSLVGGGVYVVSHASPLIKNNIVAGNQARISASGIWDPAAVLGGSPDVRGASKRPPPAGIPLYCEPIPGSGGGIYVHLECEPTIVDNVIKSNEASRDGGGVVFWDHANARFERNRVYDNVAGRNGGGIFVGCNSAPTLERNIIAWNEAMAGGGLHLQGFEADAVVRRNTLYENSASAGAGGVECDGPCRPQIVGNLVGRSRGGGIMCDATSEPSVSCNNVWGSSGDDFDGECFEPGVVYSDLNNGTEVLELCAPRVGDFRPCDHPLYGECGFVGAEDFTCAPGGCGVAKGSWGLIKTLFLDR